MLENVKSKEIIISVLGILILIILLVGITYAGFSKTSSGGNNSISSGIISMSFQEPSNNVVITNAMPTSNGYSSTTHFDFSVSGTAKAQMTLPYEITITEKSGNTLSASDVKIGLKKNGSIVTGFESGKLANTLTSSTVRSGSKTLYIDGLSLVQSGSNYTKTDNYQLFLWVDSSAVLPSDGTTKYYSVTVNINSSIGALGAMREVYVVSDTEMKIGNTLPNGVNERSTPALAMQDWQDIIGTPGATKPFYLKHALNGINEIEESYVEFVVTQDMATANPGMVAGTYSLKGGDMGDSYESNIDVIKTAFGYSTNPSRCVIDVSSAYCQVSLNATVIFNATVNWRGYVHASEGIYACFVFDGLIESGSVDGIPSSYCSA